VSIVLSATSVSTATRLAPAAARAFVKWAGGKRSLLPQLLQRALRHENVGTYYELFVGGGALFWALQARKFAKRYVLADSNARLIRTYAAIRDHVEDLIVELRSLKYNRDTFDRHRAMAVDSPAYDDVVVARWMIYLNKTGFNGLYRVNRRGQFNVPFGRYDHPTICDAENLRACSRALQGVELRTGDFEMSCPDARSGDFVYFDLPFVPASRSANFTGYGKEGFGPEDQERLRNYALELREQRGVRVLLSNSEAARPLYEPRFHVTAVSARRTINCKPGARGAAPEILAE
jgi:DNA adenine methylase